MYNIQYKKKEPAGMLFSPAILDNMKLNQKDKARKRFSDYAQKAIPQIDSADKQPVTLQENGLLQPAQQLPAQQIPVQQLFGNWPQISTFQLKTSEGSQSQPEKQKQDLFGAIGQAANINSDPAAGTQKSQIQLQQQQKPLTIFNNNQPPQQPLPQNSFQQKNQTGRAAVAFSQHASKTDQFDQVFIKPNPASNQQQQNASFMQPATQGFQTFCSGNQPVQNQPGPFQQPSQQMFGNQQFQLAAATGNNSQIGTAEAFQSPIMPIQNALNQSIANQSMTNQTFLNPNNAKFGVPTFGIQQAKQTSDEIKRNVQNMGNQGFGVGQQQQQQQQTQQQINPFAEFQQNTNQSFLQQNQSMNQNQ